MVQQNRRTRMKNKNIETKIKKIIIKKIGETKNEYTGHDIVFESKREEAPTILKMKKDLDSEFAIRLDSILKIYQYAHIGKDDWKTLNMYNLIVWLQLKGYKSVEKSLVPLLKSNWVELHDPLFDYLENLEQWDEKKDPDYISELASYVETNNNKWFQVQFKKMLVRVLACGLNLIPFAKQTWTLVGQQNDGKTTFVRFLCPPSLKKYYKENIDIHSKDGLADLATKIFGVIDELDQHSKREMNRFKTILTAETINVRLPYDKRSTTFDRRISFFATTNSTQFLSDETGNVRWLVFKVNNIKHDNGGANGYNKNVDIDKVYSQAYSLLLNGFQFNLSREEILKSENMNLEFQTISLEGELIKDKLIPGSKVKGCYFITSSGLNTILKNYTSSNISIYKIGKAMRQLGFEYVQGYIKVIGKDGKEIKQSRRGYAVKLLDNGILELYKDILHKY